VAEGSEFELPVPVSKLSDDSIMLEFAAARRIALISAKLSAASTNPRQASSSRSQPHRVSPERLYAVAGWFEPESSDKHEVETAVGTGPRLTDS
jgi:hypothetical protein